MIIVDRELLKEKKYTISCYNNYTITNKQLDFLSLYMLSDIQIPRKMGVGQFQIDYNMVVVVVVVVGVT